MTSAPDTSPEPVLEVVDLVKHFPIRAGLFRREVGRVHAVDGVTFNVYPEETLGIVGESGCGKSTLGRAILRLHEPTSGEVRYRGEDVVAADDDRMRELRREMQMVFQDPFASLNPRMPVGDSIGEPLLIHGSPRKEIRDRVRELLSQVGLSPEHANRYPHEFSGGQRQRIGIARSLALNPDLVVLDEPVSALDVSVQAQVLNLLEDLQDEYNLAYMFIAHDLSVVRHISHRIAIMYAGRLVEVGDRDTIYENPTHPYTEALLSSVPIPDPALQRERQRIALPGEIPNPMNPPSGCRFHTRCPIAADRCVHEDPPMVGRGPEHRAACWER